MASVKSRNQIYALTYKSTYVAFLQHTRILYLWLLLLVTVSACKKPYDYADQIYYGGTIYTMDKKQPKVQAVLVKNGLIMYVGTQSGARSFIGENTTHIHLKNATLLPGFIDTHSHLTNVAMQSQIIELSPSPKGVINSMAEFQSALQDFISDQKYPEDMPLIASGYTLKHTKEHRIPNIQEMDAISNTHPLILVLDNNLPVATNSKMAEFLGITPRQIFTAPQYSDILANNLRYLSTRKKLSVAQYSTAAESSIAMRIFLSNQMLYLSYGYTTLSDAKSLLNNINLLQSAAKHKMLLADVVYHPDYQQLNKSFEDLATRYNKYHNRLKMGGYKFTLDGELINQTAYLQHPYPHHNHYKGYAIYDDAQLYKDLHRVFAANMTVQIHANGDAAVQQAIRVVGGLKEIGIYHDSLKATLLHGQNILPNQLDQIKQAGLGLSFTSFALDKHAQEYYTKSLSTYQLDNIFPMRQALEKGILTTLHQDAPIFSPNILLGVQSAVTRKTHNRKTLGTHQKISVLQALESITINAAHQIHEQHLKGSIEVGKYADFVILQQDPFQVNQDSINRIKVVKTIKNSQVVYDKDNHRPLYDDALVQ